MAQRFYSRLDLDTFDKFNKELVGDAAESKDGIIFQQVDVYKISVKDTRTNIYGETVGGKVFRDGVRINEIVDAFNTLAPGEDIIHGNDIQIKELQGTQRAFEYGKYTDDILDKIHLALKTPRTMWTDPDKARPIFEPYERYLKTMIEMFDPHLLN